MLATISVESLWHISARKLSNGKLIQLDYLYGRHMHLWTYYSCSTTRATLLSQVPHRPRNTMSGRAEYTL